MSNRFMILMHRFQLNLATEEERHELMLMVESGTYKDVIGEEWERLLKINLQSIRSDDVDLKVKLDEIRRLISLEGDKIYPIQNQRNRSKVYLWVSVAAAIALILVTAIFWNNGVHETGLIKPTDIVQETINSKIFSGKQFVSLPDGSTVILNEGSELKYEASFGNKIREVYLSGEAYFDIAHNSAIPFLVRTGRINTRVLGTAFNVEAWPDQSEVKVTVTRGKVSVGDDDHVYEELVPNEQLAVNTKTDVFEKKKLDAEDALVWKSSFFVLDKVTMEEAAQRIGKQYNVEVFIENIELKKCLVNGAFLENENVEHVISVICLAMNAKYKIEGDKIGIIGGVGCE